MRAKQFSIALGNETLIAEFNDLADQAHGSCLVRCGDTAVLATAVMTAQAKEGQGFFPLTVDYEEKFYAAGAILGSQYVRREGRPSDEAILSGRIVDRTIRPLFPPHIRNEVQVVITVLAIDKYDPDVLGVIAASLALATSHIPWNGPVSAVRIGRKKNEKELIINPDYLFRHGPSCVLDLTMCGKDSTINMIEVGAREENEETIVQAFGRAEIELEKLQKFQEGIVAEIGKPKADIPKPEAPEMLIKLFDTEFKEKLEKLVEKGAGTKQALHEFENAWVARVKTEHDEMDDATVLDFLSEHMNEVFHRMAIEHKKRPDGRKLDEIRPLAISAGGISAALHGAGSFFRGETHVLSILTLGGPQDSQVIDTMESQGTKKRFMHHYNFPPFSVGETGRMGGTNRRMIGHGALAEKALEPSIPDISEFPYTIRLVSECFASNGSTSMASVCAGTIALLDGGVPIQKPVAGISIGLMMESSQKYELLTDIQGPEDHYGDMDFKVAGTRDGINAIQLDIKLGGVPISILTEALDKAKTAREHIINEIIKVIPGPRTDISPRAPKIIIVKIKPDQIGMVIGGGGKTINEIRETTGAEIDIEEDGKVFVTGKNGSAEKAADIIRSMTREYKAGETFEGVVTKILDFGAFVKIGHNAEGLVHISEIAPFRINKVSDVLKEGEVVPVIVKEIDERGRISLSIKERDKTFAEKKGLIPTEPPKPPQA